MLAYRLDLREILVAGAEFYRPRAAPTTGRVIGHFPDRRAARRAAGPRRGRGLGDRRDDDRGRWRGSARPAATPVSAVIHYKPGRSRVHGAPDHCAATVDGWVTYPYKAGG